MLKPAGIFSDKGMTPQSIWLNATAIWETHVQGDASGVKNAEKVAKEGGK